jgi:DNA-binding SARP family transcriptional activator/tetratricopeptide (TPR) repeat protein
MPRLALALLGSPQVTLDGAAVRFDTRKAVALLAYLACTGHPHSRDALAALLWPEYADARNALRRTLSTVQRTLGEGWLDVGRDQIAVVARAELWLDTTVFAAGIREALGREELAAAAALYRDDFLAGFTLRDSPAFDEWQFFEAERFRQQLASALERLAELSAAAGAHDAAIDVARRRLALDPLHEPAHRDLMRHYAIAGQRAAALRQYRACARALEQELGIAPSDETVQLYETIRVTSTPAPQRLATPGQPTPPPPYRDPGSTEVLVGRASERARLRTVYAAAPSGALAALSGPPGIGKTSLAEDLLIVVRAGGGATLAARCYEGEAGLAYAPVAALLREAVATLDRSGRFGALPPDQLAEVARLVPALARRPDLRAAPPLAGPDARRRFFEAVADLLLAACAGAAAGVLFVDDAHWADSASLDLLAFLARRLRGRPALLLLTWRDEEVPSGHPLRALIADARRVGTAELLALRGLDAAAVAELARAHATPVAPALVERLYQESEGVPLFVVEYLAALREGGPPPAGSPWPLPLRARDLLEARLRPLSAAARHLLAAAAAVGRAFDIATLCAAAALTEDGAVDGLEELLARGLVVEVSAAPLRYAFSHEQLRSLSYEQTSLVRRRLLHRRVVTHLVALFAATAQPGLSALIASHAADAGDVSLAAAHHRLAGDEARALAANAEALTHYRAALEFGHPEVAALHEALGDLLALAGAYPGALTHYDAAHKTGGPDPAVARKMGEIQHRLGEWDAAAQQFAAVLAASEANPAERARASAAWSLTARRGGDLVSAARLVGQALALAEVSHDPRALARAHAAAGTLADQEGDRARALAHLERGLALAEQVDDPETRVSALNSLALALAETDPVRAIALAEAALGLCLARDDRHRAAALHNTLADLRHAQGEREVSLVHLRKAVALFAAIGHDQPEIWMLTEW